MCCTMTMPGTVRGSVRSTVSSAWVPPVEVPMAMMRSAVPAVARTARVPGSPCPDAAHTLAGVSALMPAPGDTWTAAPDASRR